MVRHRYSRTTQEYRHGEEVAVAELVEEAGAVVRLSDTSTTMLTFKLTMGRATLVRSGEDNE
jgi:hypothetical protein